MFVVVSLLVLCVCFCCFCFCFFARFVTQISGAVSGLRVQSCLQLTCVFFGREGREDIFTNLCPFFRQIWGRQKSFLVSPSSQLSSIPNNQYSKMAYFGMAYPATLQGLPPLKSREAQVLAKLMSLHLPTTKVLQLSRIIVF